MHRPALTGTVPPVCYALRIVSPTNRVTKLHRSAHEELPTDLSIAIAALPRDVSLPSAAGMTTCPATSSNGRSTSSSGGSLTCLLLNYDPTCTERPDRDAIPWAQARIHHHIVVIADRNSRAV